MVTRGIKRERKKKKKVFKQFPHSENRTLQILLTKSGYPSFLFFFSLLSVHNLIWSFYSAGPFTSAKTESRHVLPFFFTQLSIWMRAFRWPVRVATSHFNLNGPVNSGPKGWMLIFGVVSHLRSIFMRACSSNRYCTCLRLKLEHWW